MAAAIPVIYLAGYLWWHIIRRLASGKNHLRVGEIIDRKRRPFAFWATLAVQIFLAAAVTFALIRVAVETMAQ
jgi:hypothetical protein